MGSREVVVWYVFMIFFFCPQNNIIRDKNNHFCTFFSILEQCACAQFWKLPIRYRSRLPSVVDGTIHNEWQIFHHRFHRALLLFWKKVKFRGFLIASNQYEILINHYLNKISKGSDMKGFSKVKFGGAITCSTYFSFKFFPIFIVLYCAWFKRNLKCKRFTSLWFNHYSMYYLFALLYSISIFFKPHNYVTKSYMNHLNIWIGSYNK